MVTWTTGEVSAWRRGHSAHAMLLWQPHWNEGGGVVAQMAEPSLSVLIWHTQAQLDTQCSPSPQFFFPPYTPKHSISQSTYCELLLPQINVSVFYPRDNMQTQIAGQATVVQTRPRQVLYCTSAHTMTKLLDTAACSWPSFSEMHHWMFFLPSISLLSSASSVPQLTLNAEGAAAAAVKPLEQFTVVVTV